MTNNENDSDLKMEEQNFDDDYGQEFIISDHEEEKPIEGENLVDFREKIKKSGVCYLSYIPEGLNVGLLRSKMQKYGVSRIYLIPDKKITSKKQTYKEGWVEYKSKLYAKLCEYELNGEAIGGKKRHNELREEIWSIKYLHKFKWHHLMEKLNFNKKLREQRMKTEIAQARRETNFILEKFEQSKNINRLKNKRAREENIQNVQNSEENNNNETNTEQKQTKTPFTHIRRNFKQRTPIIKNKK